jgi:hypothetical protein
LANVSDLSGLLLPACGQNPGKSIRDERILMAAGYMHTVYKQGNWLNEIEGQGELTGHYTTKEAAVSVGRAEAKRRETGHVIHNQDGTISERNSYGNDPADRPG